MHGLTGLDMTWERCHVLCVCYVIELHIKVAMRRNSRGWSPSG